MKSGEGGSTGHRRESGAEGGAKSREPRLMPLADGSVVQRVTHVLPLAQAICSVRGGWAVGKLWSMGLQVNHVEVTRRLKGDVAGND